MIKAMTGAFKDIGQFMCFGKKELESVGFFLVLLIMVRFYLNSVCYVSFTNQCL